MRVKKEIRAEKEWRWQETWEKMRQENKERAIIERKCFFVEVLGTLPVIVEI